jgi:CubicO group peptidase (beta-lactamase class C family)
MRSRVRQPRIQRITWALVARSLGVVTSLFFLLTGCAGSRSSDTKPLHPPLGAQVQKFVTSLMEKYGVPGVSIARLEQGRLQAVQGFGFIDDTRTNQVQANTTVFEAASLGKPLFAYAVVQSAEAGQINLSAPVQDYLGSQIVADPSGRNITATHLLSHSSGLALATGQRILGAPPGSGWQYSGLGYSVLQHAMERVSRSSLDEFMRGALFEPLEMHNTVFKWTPDGSTRLAVGHDRMGTARPPSKLTSPSAASSLRTTVVDYARFMERMFIDLSAPSNSSAVGQRMLQPVVDVDPALGLSWGLGWAVASQDGEELFLHWGSNPGYRSLVVGSVNRGLGLVVLTNGDNGLELAASLVPAVFGNQYSFLRFKMLHPNE